MILLLPLFSLAEVPPPLLFLLLLRNRRSVSDRVPEWTSPTHETQNSCMPALFRSPASSQRQTAVMVFFPFPPGATAVFLLCTSVSFYRRYSLLFHILRPRIFRYLFLLPKCLFGWVCGVWVGVFFWAGVSPCLINEGTSIRTFLLPLTAQRPPQIPSELLWCLSLAWGSIPTSWRHCFVACRKVHFRTMPFR